MKHWVRRTFTLSALVVMTTIGFAATAQPLPVPPQPPAAELTVPIEVNSPEAGAEVSAQHKFMWQSELQPDKYMLKFKRPNGTILKYTVPAESCTIAGICSVKLEETGILNKVKDGAVIKWRVIAVQGGIKTRTSAMPLTVNTVDKPTLLNTIGGDMHGVDKDLTWTASYANSRYVLIIRNATTGELVLKRPVLSEHCTPSVCSFNPILSLDHYTAYSWFVKAKGYNGDKVKSATEFFVTGAWAMK